MQYQEFLQYIKSRVEESFPLPNKLIVHPIMKNNNLKLDALSITGEGRGMSPVIYLKHYYDEYMEGREIDTIIQEIIQIYQSQNTSRMEILPYITDFKEIAENITYRLINRKMNKERLINIPHTVIEDLAKIYVLIIKSDTEGIASVIITDSLLKEWNIDLEMLNGRADINTPTLFPYTLRGMNEVIRDIIGNDLAEYSEGKVSNDELKDYEDDMTKLINADKEEEVMYVLSNTKGINGASALLYPKVLHDFADRMNAESLYILPSSVHELIILLNRGRFDKEALKGMVMDVNQSQVPVDEILSEEVYYYDLKTDKFAILSN